MPVTQNKYLNGRIVETNYLSSRVLLLNDLNSRIPVTFDEKGTQAILTGGGTKPTLSYSLENHGLLKMATFLLQEKMEFLVQVHQLEKQKIMGKSSYSLIQINCLCTVNLIKPTKEFFNGKRKITKNFCIWPINSLSTYQ